MILTGPYAGTRWNWDFEPFAVAAPFVLGLGSVNGALYAMMQKYEIVKTITGGPYLFPQWGHGDPPAGPTYINRLLCLVSSEWSGDFQVVDTLDVSAGWMSDLQMRTSADETACYGVALRSGFWEVFANGTPHLVSFGGPPTSTYNMNYPVIIKEPAGYSFWW